MLTSDFDFELPPDLIAQHPLAGRADSRMMVLGPGPGETTHRSVTQFPSYLQDGDVVVFNNSRVLPARLLGRWHDTGGAVEFLLLEPCVEEEGESWVAMSRTGRKLRAGLGAQVGQTGGLDAEVLQVREAGRLVVRLSSADTRGFSEILEEQGIPPLPPYIRRGSTEDVDIDRVRYQTIYAEPPGSAAAPTAGLHFTPELLAAIDRAGASRCMVTLHVGPGTFKPVQSERVEDHTMHSEWYEVSAETADIVNRARAAGRRIVAVGSTSLRTLESAASAEGVVQSGQARTEIFIRPGYRFRAVDALLTNFHLPCSTLLMMVCALGGQADVLDAYRTAVEEKYRFYSYGDCMLLLPSI